MTRAEKRRTELLKAARTVVTEGGFRDLQMNTVAQAAGVAVGTIYSYFPSKSALCAQLVASVSQREVDVLNEIALSGEPPEVMLRTAVRAFTERAFRSGRLAYAVIAEPVDPEVEDMRLRYRAEIGRVVGKILSAGVADGSFRCHDIETASVCIVGAFMEGVIGGPCAAGAAANSGDLAASLDQIAAFCVAGVLAPQSADVVPMIKNRKG
jgi:AcrR family transcriptional regulator